MARSTSALSLATVLSVVALLPFAAGVYYAFVHSGDDAARSLHWLLAYLATIVSFIGGGQWGRMLAAKQAPPQDMVLAVVPALIAWPALLMSGPWPFFLLLAALVVAWLGDENGARQGWQGRGFLQIRRVITLLVAICVILIGWRVLRG